MKNKIEINVSVINQILIIRKVSQNVKFWMQFYNLIWVVKAFIMKFPRGIYGTFSQYLSLGSTTRFLGLLTPVDTSVVVCFPSRFATAMVFFLLSTQYKFFASQSIAIPSVDPRPSTTRFSLRFIPKIGIL